MVTEKAKQLVEQFLSGGSSNGRRKSKQEARALVEKFLDGEGRHLRGRKIESNDADLLDLEGELKGEFNTDYDRGLPALYVSRSMEYPYVQVLPEPSGTGIDLHFYKDDTGNAEYQLLGNDLPVKRLASIIRDFLKQGILPPQAEPESP